MSDTPKPPRLPIPPDFPVTWRQPGDEDLHWSRDLEHDPGPILPLEATARQWTQDGIAHGLQYWDVPGGRPRGWRLNTFWFSARDPGYDDPQARERAAARLHDLAGRLEEHWDTVWQPAILTQLARLDAMDLAQPREALPILEAACRELWAIHFEIVFPASWCLRQLNALAEDLFPGQPDLSAAALTAGVASYTAETRAHIDRLAAEARRLGLASALVALDLNEERDPREQIAALPAGPPWLELMGGFLDQYGKKLAGGLTAPSWREDPRPVFQAVRSTLLGEGSARRSQAELQASRTATEERVWRLLEGYPEPVRQEFSRFLRAARAGARLIEDHNFYIDQQTPYYFRQVALAVGAEASRRGLIHDPADIFYCEWDELRALLLPGARPLGELVERRRQEMAQWSTRPVPTAIGREETPRLPHPLWEGMKPPSEPPASRSGILTGMGASPGIATGAARVVRNMADARQLVPGEVLVAPSASPSWAPWFATAAAVVTEQGGVLSHAGIVAREYGIPAVLGVAGALERVRSGSQIRVDGQAGTVELLDGPS